MADTLEIFGVEYTNVAGIVAKDDNGVDQTYTKGGGHLTQDQVGFLVIPPDGSGGGGGSSDFSTATVTFMNNTNSTASIYIPMVFSEDETNAVVVADAVEIGESVFEIPLYKGMAFLNVLDDIGTPTTTGSVEYDDGIFIVTGDCTITIS